LSTFKAKLAFNAKRIVGFLKAFTRKKRGMLGLAIILFFVILALGAPLIAPYHPTEDIDLAGYRGAPAWLRGLPGFSYLNENMEPVTDPGFKAPTAIREWSVTITPENQNVFKRYSSTIGNPLGSGPGSLAITFRRENINATYGNVKVYVTKEFYFPSTSHPSKFSGDIALLVEGTSKRTIEGTVFLDIPLQLNVFIQTGNETYYLWPPLPPNNPRGITEKGEIVSTTSTWISAKSSPESLVSTMDSTYYTLKVKMYNKTGVILDPARTIFNQTRGLPAKFVYGVEIIFKDLTQPNSQVETTIYIDDFKLKTYGNCFGPLGTDQAGRDIYSQLIYGSRLSLYLGLLSTVLGVVIGLAVGLAAGYLGRVADELLMRFTDALLIIPGLPLLIVLVAVLGPSIINLILLLGFLGWMSFARLVRSQVLSIKERPFIEAAKAIGAGRIHIMTRHVLPNVMSLVWVTLATSVPGNIVAEAALSWLGFYDPNVMTWGRMLHDVQSTAGAIANWWWVLPPGFSIAAIAVAFILIGFSLDEILNPKLRKRL